MSESEIEQVPGVYRRRVGDILLTALSDGAVPAAVGVLERIAPAEVSAIFDRQFLPEVPIIQVSAFAIGVGDRVALVDTGGGVQHMPPSVGRLRSALEAAGIGEEEVDTVLLTHVHPDHCYGLVDARNRAVFPNACVMMSMMEYDFWLAPDTDTHMPEQARKYFRRTREALEPYRDRLELFSGESVLLPGVTSVPLPGHTPGHTGYAVDDGDESVLIWGDIVHIPSVQLARPEVGIAFDVDGAMATETRAALLDRVAAERTLVTGMHLDFPGFCHIDRAAEGYAVVSEPWRNDP